MRKWFGVKGLRKDTSPISVRSLWTSTTHMVLRLSNSKVVVSDSPFYVLSQKRKRKSKNIVLFSLKNFTSDCLSHVILHNKIELANYVANHNRSHKFLISSCFGILHLYNEIRQLVLYYFYRDEADEVHCKSGNIWHE